MFPCPESTLLTFMTVTQHRIRESVRNFPSVRDERMKLLSGMGLRNTNAAVYPRPPGKLLKKKGSLKSVEILEVNSCLRNLDTTGMSLRYTNAPVHPRFTLNFH